MTPELQFDHPDNATHSLRVLAEMVRVGSAKVVEAANVKTENAHTVTVTIEVKP